MAEYIKREALLTDMCNDMCGLKYTGVCENCRAVALIADTPAVDVAPVVRCKDCASGMKSDDNKYIICCRLGVGMEFDDFCSYGERKDKAYES